MLLRLGPCTQTWPASRDADRLNTELESRAAFVILGFTVTERAALFHVRDHESYTDRHDADLPVPFADAIAEVSA